MRLSRGAQRLIDVLRWYGSRFQRIFPFQSKLAAHLNVCVRQLRRYVRELADALLIRVHRAGPHASEYELAPEAVAGNVRSLSGHCPGKENRPLITVSAPHAAARIERKPAQREDGRFDGARKILLAMGIPL